MSEKAKPVAVVEQVMPNNPQTLERLRVFYKGNVVAEVLQSYGYDDEPLKNAPENAALFAEAFNVFDSTGMTPRELADELSGRKRFMVKQETEISAITKQRDELLVALELVESWFVRHKLDKAETILGTPEKPVYAELPILGTVRAAIERAKDGAA